MSATDAYRKAVNPHRWELLTELEWPLEYPSAEGEHVVAADGRRFLDLVAGYGSATLGHRDPRVVEAVQRALKSGPPFVFSLGLPDLAGPLAERLCAHAGGGISRAYFCTGGAEAIEVAMKFATATTGRTEFLSFDGAFHGLTPGALSVIGNDHWTRGLPPWSGPARHRVPYGDVERVEEILAGHGVAAVVVEAVQGIGGARAWADDALRALADCCRRHGTLLIADEVLTGIGRTGRWFAYQHAGIDPDVVVTSKGLSGGIVPVAAVLMTERVHGSIYHSLETATAHSVTFEAHLLGMAAATAVLDIVESDGLLGRVVEVGERLRSAIAGLRSPGSPLLGVRGRGLLLAFEVEGIDEPATPDGAAVCMDLLMEHGVLVYPAAHAPTWLKLTPPLTLSDAAVDFFVAALRESLAELAE